MTEHQYLAVVRILHTVIYVVLAAAVVWILIAGLAGYRGIWLELALVLTAIEGIVFVGNGMRCPLTALAKKYGAAEGWAFDTFLPERWTRYTFRFFGTLLAIGLAAIAVNR
jgi:hypothetical protein